MLDNSCITMLRSLPCSCLPSYRRSPPRRLHAGCRHSRTAAQPPCGVVTCARMPCFQRALAFVVEVRSFVRGRLQRFTKLDLQYELSSNIKFYCFLSAASFAGVTCDGMVVPSASHINCQLQPRARKWEKVKSTMAIDIAIVA